LKSLIENVNWVASECQRVLLAYIFRLRNFHSAQNLTSSVHCCESAQNQGRSENGSNIEDLNALCDILAKLSASL